MGRLDSKLVREEFTRVFLLYSNGIAGDAGLLQILSGHIYECIIMTVFIILSFLVSLPKAMECGGKT